MILTTETLHRQRRNPTIHGSPRTNITYDSCDRNPGVIESAIHKTTIRATDSTTPRASRHAHRNHFRLGPPLTTESLSRPVGQRSATHRSPTPHDASLNLLLFFLSLLAATLLFAAHRKAGLFLGTSALRADIIISYCSHRIVSDPHVIGLFPP
ncbi:MAG: hypothetical protein HUU19_12995 [Phycisphaerales bacterium]|nr:hypothetical protein [Phycisphaerales bacterium]